MFGHQRFFDRWAEAFSRCDVSAIVAMADPNIELHPVPSLRQEPFRGYEGIGDWVRGACARAETVLMTGNVVRTSADRILVVGSIAVTSAEGAVEPAEVAWVLVFRDGLVRCHETFLSIDDARAAYRGQYALA